MRRLCLLCAVLAGCGGESTEPWPGACVTSYDDLADGTVDSQSVNEYDGEDLVRVVTDRGVDGTPDEIRTYEYDAEGRLTYLDRDYDGDGTVDERGRYTYGVTEEGHDWLEWDDSDDGTVEERRVWWREDDREIMEARGGDGTFRWRTTTTFDEDGLEVSWQNDFDDDGTADVRSAFEHEDGRISAELHDYDADGAVDAVTRYEYDGDGNMILASEDEGLDGPEWFLTWTYDDRGNVLTHEVGPEADPRARTTYDYSCWIGDA